MGTQLHVEEVVEAAKRIERGGDCADLARIIKILTELEVEVGGPYALVPGGEPDIGFNLAVERLLRACGVSLPKLDAYIGATGVERAGLREAPLSEPPDIGEGVAGGQVTLSPEEARIMAHIRSAAAARFRDLSDFMREGAMGAIEKTIRGNSDRQMSLMALYLRQALGESGGRFGDEYLADLGLANIFFWTAFIIYDDFWDEDEAAEPRLLPIANLFARQYIDTFSHVAARDDSFRRLFHTMMDALDGANAWETARCRMRKEGTRVYLPEEVPAYGDFSIKFYPAAGHIFGPLAMVVDLGHAVDSPEVTHFIDYFRGYLIAMQLNDDMHDWKEDLERGHISTAVSVLLARWRERYPERGVIDLGADMPALEQLFWFGSLETLAGAALDHAQRSREALGRMTSIVHAAPLERFIRRNEDAVATALSNYRLSRDLLRVFS